MQNSTCAFISHQSTPVEQYYNVNRTHGSQDKPWWLITYASYESCLHPINSMHQFLPGQVIFFLAQFHLTIIYCLRSRNIKYDASSQQFPRFDEPKTCESSLPPSCTFEWLIWDIQNIVRNVQTAGLDTRTWSTSTNPTPVSSCLQQLGLKSLNGPSTKLTGHCMNHNLDFFLKNLLVMS